MKLLITLLLFLVCCLGSANLALAGENSTCHSILLSKIRTVLAASIAPNAPTLVTRELAEKYRVLISKTERDTVQSPSLK